MTPEATVVVSTYRPGGVDVTLAGMRDQTFPKGRFEVILVDHRYERRRSEVGTLARRYGVRLLHVPEHRRNGPWGVTASAYNTGFALATGRVVIMLVDWTYAPPGWIEGHLVHHDGPPAYVIAPYLYHAVGITEGIHARMLRELGPDAVPPWTAFAAQPDIAARAPYDQDGQDSRADSVSIEEDAVLRGEVFDEMSVFRDGLFDPAWLPRMPPLPMGDPGGRSAPPGRLPYHMHTWAHLKNESVLRDVVWRLNGVDVWGERGGRMSIDTDFGLRAMCIGAGPLWEPRAQAHCVNPRHGICRVMPFGDDGRSVAGRWNLEECRAYHLRRIEDVTAGRSLAAPAPYTMEGLARRLEPWRSGAPIDISALDVPDAGFFGRDVRPWSAY